MKLKDGIIRDEHKYMNVLVSMALRYGMYGSCVVILTATLSIDNTISERSSLRVTIVFNVL